MAQAVIIHHFPEGGSVRLVLHADVDYPDVYDDLVTRVIAMYRAAVFSNNEADREP
jgi:hypothetical protein